MNTSLIAARRRAASKPNLIPARAHKFDWYHEGSPPELRSYNHPAPDGSLTAVKLVESTENRQHYVFNFDTGDYPNNAPATFSVYLKYAGRAWVQVNAQYYWTPHVINLNLVTGEVRPSNVRGYRVQRLPDGWYRVSVMENNTTTTKGISGSIKFLADDLSESYPGDGISGVLAWGPVFNSGYVPAPFTA